MSFLQRVGCAYSPGSRSHNNTHTCGTTEKCGHTLRHLYANSMISHSSFSSWKFRHHLGFCKGGRLDFPSARTQKSSIATCMLRTTSKQSLRLPQRDLTHSLRSRGLQSLVWQICF